MAETYSVEYALENIVVPRGNVYRRHIDPLCRTYTQVGAGTAGDTVLISKLPSQSLLSMYGGTYFYFTGWTSGTTLSIGWQAYTDMDGVAVAASATGLLNAISMTNAGLWANGALLVNAYAQSAGVVGAWKDFNNRSEVVIYATIGAQAPANGGVLNCCLMNYHS